MFQNYMQDSGDHCMSNICDHMWFWKLLLLIVVCYNVRTLIEHVFVFNYFEKYTNLRPITKRKHFRRSVYVCIVTLETGAIQMREYAN